MRSTWHLSVAVLALSMVPPALAQSQDNTGSAAFTVFVRGARVGAQQVEVSRSATGWLIASTGRLEPPFDLVTTKFEAAYSLDWRPQRLAIDARLRGEPLALTTTFSDGTARNEYRQAGGVQVQAIPVSVDAVVLPNSFFGAYEALAARLAGRVVGDRLPVFAAPEAEAVATIDRITPRRIATPDGIVEVRDYVLTLAGPAGPVAFEIWVDSRQRLARVVIPAAAVVVLREDLASVMSREEPVSHPGDEAVYIPANGFSLAATLTKPQVTAAGRRGAVVLVASPGPQGREHMSYGIPIFGQLAGKLADAGVLVVRYDARGVGQSGGRTESAGIPEYAEDALAVVSWLRRRQDVDAERVVVAGYADGGPVALTAASRSKDVKGVILLAAPGRSGRDVTLEQQERALSAASVTDANRQERIALQTRIMDAVVTGKGWDTLPKALRTDVDSIWFRTWLQFAPADSFKRVNQPVFIGHGALDQEMPSTHAEALAALARARKVPPQHTTITVLPRLNHLFLPAQSGAVNEYPSLSEREISADLVTPLTEWLRTVGRPR